MKRLSLMLAALAVTLIPIAAQDSRPTTQPADPKVPADKGEVVTTDSGLKYCVLRKGTGTRHPKMGDKLKVHYSGWLTDGTLFDSSVKRNRPFDTQIGRVIQGWNEGLALMTVGSKFKFTIPYKLAYGERGSGRIPPKSDLIFEVELLELEPGPEPPEYKKLDPEKTVTTESGLKYEIVEPGEGASLGDADIAMMSWALWNEDGKLLGFSSEAARRLSGNKDRMPYPFLKEAFGIMRRGMDVVLVVPPDLAFGSMPRGDLPANSVTVWRLGCEDVVSFEPPAGVEPQKTESGIEYWAIKPGKPDGKQPTAASTVKAHYTGWLTDGKMFDSSHQRGSPSNFPLGSVIKGWQQGIPLMTEGAVYRFKIPWALAYGENGRGGMIPPKADLVFLVELIEVM